MRTFIKNCLPASLTVFLSFTPAFDFAQTSDNASAAVDVCVSEAEESVGITKIYSLEELFRIAEENSRAVKLSDLKAQESDQQTKVTKNAWLPSIKLSASASYLGDGYIMDRNFSNGQTADMPHFGNNFAIEAEQIIYEGGAVSNAVKLNKLASKQAKVDQESTRQDIRFMIVGSYMELFRLRNQIEVYKKNIEQTQKLVDDIMAKQSEGLALKNDITRYCLQLQSLKLRLLQVENSAKIINVRLVTALHLDPSTVIGIDNSMLSSIPEAGSEKEWSNKAEANDPGLKKAQIGIEQSKAGESLSKSGYIPKIALFAADHLDGPITIEVPAINSNFNYWYVGLGLTFDISNLYKSGREVNLSKFKTKQAQEALELQKENLKTEINSAYVRFVESFCIYETSKTSQELATENYNVVNNRYMNDLALITDMLDASNQKLESELQVANAQINILFQYYNLKKVAGTL